jgi:hypothetical protein
VQKLLPCGPHGRMLLKVTVARMYAAGEPLPDDGLIPDVAVEQGGRATVRCAGGDGEARAAVALGPSGGADPALSIAAALIRRYGSPSRGAIRAAIDSASCFENSIPARGTSREANDFLMFRSGPAAHPDCFENSIPARGTSREPSLFLISRSGPAAHPDCDASGS